MLRGPSPSLERQSDQGERHANARGHLHDGRRHGSSVPCGRGRCRKFRARNVVATVNERIQALRRPAEKMFEFYGPALGFEQLVTFNPADAVGGVARFQAGAQELKLTGRVPDRTYVAGGVRDATGVRLLSFFFASEGELVRRFEAHGLAHPEFRTVGDRRSALVTDPDGQSVELVIEPDAPAARYRKSRWVSPYRTSKRAARSTESSQGSRSSRQCTTLCSTL